MRVSSLVLCEDVRKEITGTHTIVGQFNTMRGYLLEKYTFKVFFSITDYVGVAKLKVVVRAPSGTELKQFFLDDIPCTSKNNYGAGYFTITNLFLKAYGGYTVHIYDKNDRELNVVGMNYLVPNFKSNTLMIRGKLVEVPRVNYHDNEELQSYAKLFLRKYTPLESSYKSVEFHSQFTPSDGIGSVSCFLVNQMIKRGIKVRPVPIYTDPDSIDFVKGISEEDKLRGEADITIVNTLPPHMKSACNAKRTVLLSYWEASRICKSWVNVSNTADAVLVPSSYVKEVYKESGVTVPTLVYKQPISSEFKYKAKEANKKYFDILFLGTSIPRKGADIFVKAVDKVFGNDKSVRIRMHMKPWSEALGDTRRQLFERYKDKKQYLLTTNVLTTSEIVALLQSSDLLVAPSRSEGLGLIPIQSVMCGTPAIVPNHSGFKEYNTTPGFMSIKNHKVTRGEGIYAEGEWFEPDFDELCDLLVFVKNNKEVFFKDAEKGSAILREEYSEVSTYMSLEALINNIYLK